MEKREKGGETLQEIPVTQIGGIRIGQTEDSAAGTGCTVFLCPEGMRAGLDVRGGGPASRDSRVLDPIASAQTVHAVVLAGGSAFGLGAANGVMAYLADRGIGLPVGTVRVPLVVQSDLFDLLVGDPAVFPDPAMGREAARLAMEAPNYRDGCFGAGCGATIGKAAGTMTAMKAGIGSFAVELGGLRVGAVAALNAFGDIYDWRTGRKLAGLLKEDRSGFRSALDVMAETLAPGENEGLAGNTTLGVILTNARFDKPQLCKLAGMAQDGVARAVRPVHTSVDGDSVYAVSAGTVPASLDLAGTLAADCMSEAILRAVYAAESAYGRPAARDLPFCPPFRPAEP